MWTALLAATQSGQANANTYDYVYVSKDLPGDGHRLTRTAPRCTRTPANTGVAAAPTADGTFPVYEHLTSHPMKGPNPDGSTYDDPRYPLGRTASTAVTPSTGTRGPPTGSPRATGASRCPDGRKCAAPLHPAGHPRHGRGIADPDPRRHGNGSDDADGGRGDSGHRDRTAPRALAAVDERAAPGPRPHRPHPRRPGRARPPLHRLSDLGHVPPGGAHPVAAALQP